MKVICIDNGVRCRKDGTVGDANVLVVGAIYTVKKEIISDYGTLSYILYEVKGTHNELGAFMADRFIPLSDIDEMELVNELELNNRL